MKHLGFLSKILLFLVILLAPILQVRSFAQSNADLKNFFKEAESHFLYSEYELATPLYLVIYTSMKDNANIAYKIGVCYLNTPQEKEKAIPYLEKAAKNVNYDADEEQFSETRAPLQALFQLGNAYRIDNQIDKAINTYRHFKKLLSSKNKMINEDFVNQQIVACQNAKKLMKNPLNIRKTNLGDTVNISSINESPVISGDGNTLVFTAHFGEDLIIYFTKKIHGHWIPPSDITTEIGSDKDCSSSSLNYDGTELYLYKTDNYIGNIYISKYNGEHWTKIKKLNKNINTKYYESHASISKDGSSLYFTSNREGGIGELDIYVSHREKNGAWGRAKNLGPVINTKYNENTPFISMNDSLLFFSSEGHYNMGGYDFFVAGRKGDGWNTPENIGYPISTTGEDLHFQPYKNGKSGYLSMDNGYKERDIFRIDFPGKKEVSYFEVKGIITIDSAANSLSLPRVRVSIIDTATTDTMDIETPNFKSGWYFFHVPAGNYRIECYGEGILPHREELIIPSDAPSGEFIRNIYLNSDSTWVARKRPMPVPDTTAQDTSIRIITDVMVKNPDYVDNQGRKVLYYTVQVMALLNPVEASYFKNIKGIVILHGKDAFFRYTFGQFKTQKEAEKTRRDILQKGYPDVFVKKVYNDSEDKPEK